MPAETALRYGAQIAGAGMLIAIRHVFPAPPEVAWRTNGSSSFLSWITGAPACIASTSPSWR